MTYTELSNHITDTINNTVFTTADPSTTYWIDLGVYGNNQWAVVMAWKEPDEGEDFSQVYGYIGYMPTNSVMSEYGYDWLMPTGNDGDIMDTEIALTYANDETGTIETFSPSIIWLARQWHGIERIARKMGKGV